MKIFLLTAVLLFNIPVLFTQEPLWRTVNSCPTSNFNGRYEDISFANASTGFVINWGGAIFRTSNGGVSWTKVDSLHWALRSTTFFDINTALIGTLDSSRALYRSTDGGVTWNEVTGLPGSVHKGICGIYVVNSNTAFASGRYNGPPYLIKTTNKGISWTSINVDTSLMSSIVDCYFSSADTGLIVGGYSPMQNYSSGRAVILRTVNGGNTWQRVYTSSVDSSWCWKIQLVNPTLGFVAVEKKSPPTHILKTTNSGTNWSEIFLSPNIVNLEGIGFINENTGWVGGWGTSFSMPCYKTTNGGLNWSNAGWGINVNRFRFLNDSLGFAAGLNVYSFSRFPIGIQTISSEVPNRFSLSQNYPNPFNPVTKIKFNIPQQSFTKIIVYDALGREIQTIVSQQLSPGTYEVDFDGSALSTGVYYYKLEASSFTETKKMVLIK